jgi:hypothetical protein
VLPDADEMEKIRAGGDLQQTHFLPGFTIDLSLFFAKTKKNWISCSNTEISIRSDQHQLSTAESI